MGTATLNEDFEIYFIALYEMMAEIEDLDPRFAKVIDEHFWELVDSN